jgi:hypothetical protein
LNEQRKYAYRWLLYWAMLEIRAIQWWQGDSWQAWNPFWWRRLGRRIRHVGALADWLHNLAYFSAVDFLRFDEERFWRDFEWLQPRFPEFSVEQYRTHFEQQACPPSKAEPGRGSGPAHG